MKFGPIWIIITFCFMASCDKTVHYGCTNKYAINFDPYAEASNASCVFESTGIIYFKSPTLETFQQNGVTSISIYLDDLMVAEGMLVSELSYITGSVSCDHPDGIPFRKLVYREYDGYDETDCHLHVHDQNDSMIISRVFWIDPGCEKISVFY